MPSCCKGRLNSSDNHFSWNVVVVQNVQWKSFILFFHGKKYMATQASKESLNFALADQNSCSWFYLARKVL